MADGQLSNPIHPTPQTDDRLDRLRLVRSRRVGAVTYHRLMAEHGSARAALEALPGIAKAAGVEEYEICPLGVVQAEMKKGLALGARLLVHSEPDYPQSLADIPDAPPVLWAIGDVSLLNRP
ncbi:MAG TPA: DNA-protecting protein DprA, partial [Tabrizicola sp.]|nr:DNA-protecting protein DprA [Tabrizicola sp.]